MKNRKNMSNTKKIPQKYQRNEVFSCCDAFIYEWPQGQLSIRNVFRKFALTRNLEYVPMQTNIHFPMVNTNEFISLDFFYRFIDNLPCFLFASSVVECGSRN